NGKTALKFNYGRFLGPATNDTIYTQNNPANGIVGYNLTAINRSWTDTNGNYIVDCDILNPSAQTVPGGDVCGALTGNSLTCGGTAGGQLRDVRNRLRSGAHQLLARRRRDRHRAAQPRHDAPVRIDDRARDQRHVREHRERRQPGSALLPRSGSGRDDAPRPR